MVVIIISNLMANFLGALPSILNFYNTQFYDSTLIPTICGSTSIEAIELKKMGKFLTHYADLDGKEPFGITFINVDGRNERLENKKSWENKEEATLVSISTPESNVYINAVFFYVEY